MEVNSFEIKGKCNEIKKCIADLGYNIEILAEMKAKYE